MGQDLLAVKVHVAVLRNTLHVAADVRRRDLFWIQRERVSLRVVRLLTSAATNRTLEDALDEFRTFANFLQDEAARPIACSHSGAEVGRRGPRIRARDQARQLEQVARTVTRMADESRCA